MSFSVQFLAGSHAIRDVTRSFRGLFYIIAGHKRIDTKQKTKRRMEVKLKHKTRNTRSIRTYFQYLYARSSNKPVLVVCRALLFDSIINSIENHRAHA